jgi:phosphohistidine swiveling domain-containing protein
MMPHGFAATINGYAYTSASVKMSRRTLIGILKIYARFSKFFSAPAFDWDGVVLPQYLATIDRWKAIDIAQTSDEDLLRGIKEMAAADPIYWFGSAAKLGLSRVMDSVFDALLKSPFVRFALPRPRPVSASFLRGFESKALDAQSDMEALATTIRQSQSLFDLVINTPAPQLMAALAEHPDGQPIMNNIQRYLDTYGHQIYNLDFIAPTQIEDPLPMLLSLKALVETPPEQDVRTRQAKMAAEREALVEQTMSKLNPLSRRLFRWVWKWTKYYAPYREGVLFYMGAAWPTLRRFAHELGVRLTDHGALSAPDDIYYLTHDEIAAFIEARASGKRHTKLSSVAHERRDLRDARMQLVPPPKVPERSQLKLGPFTLSAFDPTPKDAGSDGPVLKGYAVSTGRVTAPASVIRSIEDFDQMQPGTILVATTTTPAWTPLFSQATGLVTDIGGALAHGSIVAREYGIPAVMGTGVATDRITSGMILIVDGDKGTVTLLDETDT